MSTAFAPAHITGIFQAHRHPDPLKYGSRGAGVCLKRGVYTTVKAARALKWRVRIRINGRMTHAEVSRAVVEAFKGLTSEPYELSVDHHVEVPIGAGYGSSGAGALSLALALNDALKLNLSYSEAAQIAHVAEIECGTGLGTVLAETAGGVEIRVKPGAPGIGEVKQIPTKSDEKVISVYLGQLPTRPILKDEKVQGRLSEVSGPLMERLINDPTLANFLALSREFSDRLSLYTPRLANVMNELSCRYSGVFSMNMFGEALFTLVGTEKYHECLSTLEQVQINPAKVIISDIEYRGARLIG
ncbi:MAG: hypothetical protein QXJ75_01875 [Candidatus Bathyarchaeia archaeon]